MTFSVGQPVECIDAEGAKNLSLGAVYTVLKCERGPGLWRGRQYNSFGILLVEAAPNEGDDEFAIERFRPIVEKKTEVSFTANAPKDSEKWDNRKRVKVLA